MMEEEVSSEEGGKESSKNERRQGQEKDNGQENSWRPSSTWPLKFHESVTTMYVYCKTNI